MTPQFYDTPTLSLIFTLLLHLPLAISYITPSTAALPTTQMSPYVTFPSYPPIPLN